MNTVAVDHLGHRSGKQVQVKYREPMVANEAKKVKHHINDEKSLKLLLSILPLYWPYELLN